MDGVCARTIHLQFVYASFFSKGKYCAVLKPFVTLIGAAGVVGPLRSLTQAMTPFIAKNHFRSKKESGPASEFVLGLPWSIIVRLSFVFDATLPFTIS